jgi:hypothetical protein
MNAPQPIQDCPTKRFTVSEPAIARMFAEADIAEELRRVDFTRDIRSELRQIAASLAVMW